jgi:hypothetical protein
LFSSVPPGKCWFDFSVPTVPDFGTRIIAVISSEGPLSNKFANMVHNILTDLCLGGKKRYFDYFQQYLMTMGIILHITENLNIANQNLRALIASSQSENTEERPRRRRRK